MVCSVRHKSPCFVLMLLCWVLLIQAYPIHVWAQEDATGASQTVSSPDPELSSAAKTLETFLSAFPNPEKGLDDRINPLAIKTLELPFSSVASKVSDAKILKQVIDRVVYVDYAKVEQQAAGHSIHDLAILQSGRIRLVKTENGNWLFSSQTMNALPAMWDEVRDRPIVSGVTNSPDLSLSQSIELQLPKELQNRVLFVETWKWLGIFLFICLGVLMDKLVVFGAGLIGANVLRRLKWSMPQEDIHKSVRPLGILAMAGCLQIGLMMLMLPATFDTILELAIRFLAAVSLVWLVFKIVDAVAAFLTQKATITATKLDDLLIPFFQKVIKIFVALFGTVFVASQLNINIASLLAGLGLGGLAFALAAKDTVENFFGSLTVLIDQPFGVGDWIVLENGAEGTVETVGLRSTRVRTFNNSVITIPNSKLILSTVDNYGMRRYRRWKTTLTLTYDTPPEKIEAFCVGVRELILQHPYTRKDFFQVYGNEFGSHSLDILMVLFFETPDYSTELRERHRLFLDILRLAQSLGVEFAFPTQTIHLVKELPGHADTPKNSEEAAQLAKQKVHELIGKVYGGPKIPQDPAVVFPEPKNDDLQEFLVERDGGHLQ